MMWDLGICVGDLGEGVCAQGCAALVAVGDQFAWGFPQPPFLVILPGLAS